MNAGDQVKLVGAAAEMFPERGVGFVVEDKTAPSSYVSVMFEGHEQPLLLNRRLVTSA